MTGRVDSPLYLRVLDVRPCAACGKPFERQARKAKQKYCGSCSELADLKRKKITSGRRERHSLGKEIGSAISVANARSIAHEAVRPEMLWVTRIKVPFSYAASKNHTYSLQAKGHLELRGQSGALKRLITETMRGALAEQKIAHNKVWLDILVQKSDHRGDAVNVVDLVCDGVREALPIDDRWFCIRSLDWEIVREGGSIFIGIGQDTDQDVQVCSYCGQIKVLSCFHKDSDGYLGVGRECLDCKSAVRALRKAASKTHDKPTALVRVTRHMARTA